jgi:hypothetical protein
VLFVLIASNVHAMEDEEGKDLGTVTSRDFPTSSAPLCSCFHAFHTVRISSSAVTIVYPAQHNECASKAPYKQDFNADWLSTFPRTPCGGRPSSLLRPIPTQGTETRPRHIWGLSLLIYHLQQPLTLRSSHNDGDKFSGYNQQQLKLTFASGNVDVDTNRATMVLRMMYNKALIETV